MPEPLRVVGDYKSLVTDGQLTSTVNYSQIMGPNVFGLGTFDHVDGEGVFVNGEFYRATPQSFTKVSPHDHVPFAIVSEMDEATPTDELDNINYDNLKTLISAKLVDGVIGIGIHIKGKFEQLQFRNLHNQDLTLTLDKIIKRNQKEYTCETVAGSLVGFQFVKSLEDKVGPGLHLHFVDDARTQGGHVYDIGQIAEASMQCQFFYNPNIHTISAHSGVDHACQQKI